MNLVFLITEAKAYLIRPQRIESIHGGKLFYNRGVDYDLSSHTVDRHAALDQHRKVVQAEDPEPADHAGSVEKTVRKTPFVVKVRLLCLEICACQHFPGIIPIPFKRG